MATGGGSGPGRQRRHSKSGDVEDINVNKTTCAVCLEQYRRPKVLPCFHTFCQSCIQAVAGTASSFPCPACRTPAFLPAGGAAALQTNFYVLDDVDATDPSAQRRLLCDVCSEDREATHTCLQCKQRYCLPCRKFHDSFTLSRGHSVVSLEPDEEEALKEGSRGGVTRSANTAGVISGGRRMEEMCGKHGDQRLLLHCKQCTASICLQCKLTLHEGHPTCDLTDEGSRVKVKLEGRLGEVAAQIQHLEALLAMADSRCLSIDEQQQQAERDIRNRAETLISWVDQSRDQALQNVQLTATDMKSPLLSNRQLVQEKRAELTARHNHLTRVLRDGNDADLVSLEAQLEAASSDKADLVEVEKDLAKKEPILRLRQESAAVNQMQMRAFVGVVTPSQHARDLCQGDATLDSEEAGVDDKPDGENLKKAPRDFIYSENSESLILSLCPTSNGRLWAKYNESENHFHPHNIMKLLDTNGQVVRLVEDPVYGSSLGTVLGDVTIAESSDCTCLDVIQPSRVRMSVDVGMGLIKIVHSAACGYPFAQDETADGPIVRINFFSISPLNWTTSVVLTENTFGELTDVSAEEKYFVFMDDSCGELNIYRNQVPDRFMPCGRYGPENLQVIDCRFCRIDGREMLLVLVDGDDGASGASGVHVVDHTDGGRFVRFLDTSPCGVTKPQNLATDYDKHVWIGCGSGLIVVVDL